MAVSDERVRVLADVLSSATDDGVAARLVSGVLQAADAPPLSPVCPGPRDPDAALVAAAFLDASDVMVGLAWSARTALTLYDAHEGWSGGVDELEEEQARDLVVRVGALSAVAVSLHADPHRGLARLLDSPAGRSLLYVMGSVELLLSRGTAFEPVEPGVMGELIDVHGDVLEELWDAVRTAGGRVEGARDVVSDVAAALEDAAEAVGDRIEDIAEAVRAVLPELDGGRAAWAAEARRERVYGLLVGRLLAERDGLSAPQAATQARPAPPSVDLAPLKATLARQRDQRDAVATELSAAKRRRRQLSDQLAQSTRRARPSGTPTAAPVPGPDLEREAVAHTARSVRDAQAALRQAHAARSRLRKPAGTTAGDRPHLSRARDRVAECTAAVAAVKQRQAAIQQARHAQAEASGRRRRELETRRAQVLGRQRAVAQSLLSAQRRRTELLAHRDQPQTAAPMPRPTARPTPRVDIRQHAILRGELLRARAQVVTARADASRRRQQLRTLRPPRAPASGRAVADSGRARSAVQALEQAVVATRERIETALQARRSHTEQLRARLAQARAQAAENGPLQATLAERRRRLATRRYANHRALAKAAARPAPVARPVPDTLTPERREQLEDVIFDANQALHRARWGLSRASSAQAEGAPEPPDAPDHRHIHRILKGAQAQVASAERAVEAVRARQQAAADARRSALSAVIGQRETLLRSLGSARRRRDQLRGDRKTVGPRQRAVKTRLAQHRGPTLRAHPRESDGVSAAAALLDTTLQAVIAAQEALATTAARGGSLPPLPEPRAPRTPLDLRGLGKRVRKAEKAVARLQARRDAALAALAALRAPLEAEHTRLTDRKKEAAATCSMSIELRAAARSRMDEVRRRLTELRTQLAATPAEPPDPTTGPREAVDAAGQARAEAHRRLSTALDAREALPGAPQAGDVPLLAEASRLASEERRAQVAAADAAVVTARSRRDRHVELRRRLEALHTQRTRSAAESAKQTEARDTLAEARKVAAAKTQTTRARLSALQVPDLDVSELLLMRELVAAAATALTEARTHLENRPEPDDPPTRPPAPDTAALTRRLSRARKVFAKYEKAARVVEGRRDQAYVSLRREHHAALSAARPARRLSALRRRKAALERALTARRERISALQPKPAAAAEVDAALGPAVEAARKQLAEARETLGQRVSAVAEVRGEMTRAKARHAQLDDRIDEIDARLARWTRRKRRASRAIEKLKARQEAAATPAPPPPGAPLAPPPPPAPGVPVVSAPAPPPPSVVSVAPPSIELASDPPSIDPPSVPPPQVPGGASETEAGKSSVQSLLARIAARRQARSRPAPPRRESDSGSVPPPMVPGLRTATAQQPGPPPPPPVASKPAASRLPATSPSVPPPLVPPSPSVPPPAPTPPAAAPPPSPAPPVAGPPPPAAPPPPVMGPPAGPPPPLAGPPAPEHIRPTGCSYEQVRVVVPVHIADVHIRAEQGSAAQADLTAHDL